MAIKILIILLSMLIMSGAIVFWPYEVRIESDPENRKVEHPNFPINVYSEDDDGEISIYSVIIIPAEHYNQADIIRVLKWYSSQKEQYHTIVVRLYTTHSSASSYVPRPRSFCQEDAKYIKMLRANRQYDEWLMYRRFLHIPVCSNRVIISGRYDGPWP